MDATAQNQHFDVVVIGAGPGGYVAAIRASQLGKSVAIVEKQYWGGVCLNIGCIPTKVLLRHAEIANLVSRHAQTFGLPEGIQADFLAAHTRSREVSAGRTKGVHYLMKKNGITEFEGVATFESEHELSVSAADSSEAIKITFDNVIIATGSTVRTIPDVEFGTRITGYEELVLATEMPKSLVIIGAGPIGVEFACVAASFGSAVTVIEYLDRILPLEDSEISAELSKALKKLGINIITSARVSGASENETSASVTFEVDGQAQQLEADHVMVSVGFAANVAGFGIEKTGVRLNEHGAIEVDSQLRTSVPHIFAIGDVTAKLSLAHVAEAQGVLAAEVIGSDTKREMGDYRFMPRAVYSLPQVASFGLTEAQALEEYPALKISKFPFVANGKAHAIGETSGFVKLIADETTGKLVGAHLVGPDVSELLPELTLTAEAGLNVSEIVHNVHSHPTLSESLQEAIRGLSGDMINFWSPK